MSSSDPTDSGHQWLTTSSRSQSSRCLTTLKRQHEEEDYDSEKIFSKSEKSFKKSFDPKTAIRALTGRYSDSNRNPIDISIRDWIPVRKNPTIVRQKTVPKETIPEVNEWPFSYMYSVKERIAFDGLLFEYDKSFLDNLKELRQLLVKQFRTPASRQKSRAVGYTVVFDDVVNIEEEDLIVRIKDNIGKIIDFINESEQKLKEKQKNRKRGRPKGKNNCKESSQTLTSRDIETLVNDNVIDDQRTEAIATEDKVVLYRENVPSFLHHYFDSLGKTEYRFSSADIKIAFGAKDMNSDKRSQPLSQNNSQVMSQISVVTDDFITTGLPPIPQRCPLEMLDCWAGTGNYYSDDYVYKDIDCSVDPKTNVQPFQCSNTQNNFSQSQRVESAKDLNTNSRSQQIEIVNRHKWANTDFNISTGIVLKDQPQNKVRTQLKRHKQIKFVLEKILMLIEGKNFCTKRDLYYQNVLLFEKSQRVVDEIIDDLACSLRVSRSKLHIVSSTRGLVFGHLKFQNTNGVETNCLSSPNGINIPNETSRLSRFRSKALFVLIIEKDATFQQLIDLNIHKRYPLIMITGHGYPDMNTRAFVQILWNTFEIPIFGLVDGDGHGLEILCTFKFGSLALSYESPNLVVPAIKWIGITPTDILQFKLSKNVQIPLNDNDRKKIKDLKQRMYMKGNKEWTKQLDILLKIGTKVEIQSLAEHDPSFLFNVYLPAKIRYGKWF